MNQKPDFLAALDSKMVDILTQNVNSRGVLDQVAQLFSLFFEKASDNVAVGFTTLFSRIAYTGVQHDMPGKLLFDNHYFRKTLESGSLAEEDIKDHIHLGIYLIQRNGTHIYDYSWRQAVKKPTIRMAPLLSSTPKSFKRILNAYLLSITAPTDSDDDKSPAKNHILELIDDDQPHLVLKATIDNKDFTKQLHQILKVMPLPLSVNLVDVTYLDDDSLRAKGIVLRPNLLFGVTSISECFSFKGPYSRIYLGRKLIPSGSSVNMLIGNIVNQYLDELIHNPDLDFNTVLKSTFKIAPEMFTMMSDTEVRECIGKIKGHFMNLKKVVNTELIQAGITKEKSYLEPSFYSNEYGIQGRLDLYHHDESSAKSDIVELKSGRIYQAHTYGLNENHYMQTLLYDLLIESVYKGSVKSTSYILYSGNAQKRLRFAAKVRAKQLEAMRLRNNLIMMEEILTRIDDDDKYEEFLTILNPEKIPDHFTFLRRDAKTFWDAYKDLDPLEIQYYKSFIAFIGKELRLSKIGRHGIHRSNGLASLWLDPMLEKVDRFTILSYLEVTKNDSDQEVPTITLSYSELSNKLSKFRVGDITVLYPYVNDQYSALSNQIFKCTILELNASSVTIRLRARQKNFELFRKFKYWNIESDSLDSGYRQQYHGLFDFINAPKEYRDRLLTSQPPAQPVTQIAYAQEGLTEEQLSLINRAINAQDYFLLWGPPGTGKTSMMIANMVRYYYEQTDQDIILLAYTNRAVDEICSAIHDVINGDYVRIGSRYSTDARYVPQLLSSKSAEVKNRAELKKIFTDTRIFVSTISSYQGKRDLRNLKKFDVAIIDEASQLLEPMLAGMLSQFKKYILIGDHKQLPAVVTQSRSESLVKYEGLQELGLSDRRVSLFERMYRRAIEMEWNWAYGALTMQGRMHKKILDFVSPEFYEGSLSVLPSLSRLTAEPALSSLSELQEILVNNRMIFIDTPVDPTVIHKSNAIEAHIVALLTTEWLSIYKTNDVAFTQNTLGVITPFRSQIAMIKDQEIFKQGHPITVDTIERYQGGSRDQIIISLAVTQANLLDSITNVSEEGIDRKLNVALTRVKEHLIILGSRNVLIKNPTYDRLIKSCYILEAKKYLKPLTL